LKAEASTPDLAILTERHPKLFHGAAKDVDVLKDRPSILSYQRWLPCMDNFDQHDGRVRVT
jgi:hypothetical protein